MSQLTLRPHLGKIHARVVGDVRPCALGYPSFDSFVLCPACTDNHACTHNHPYTGNHPYTDNHVCTDNGVCCWANYAMKPEQIKPDKGRQRR